MNFPYQPDQLTAEWLTATLRQAGVLDAARVVAFEVKPVGEGLEILGQNRIIRLAYDAVETAAPQSLFAKFALADAETRAIWRTTYRQEVLFYRQFARRVTLPTPRAYFSEFDEASGCFLILMEDCSYGDIGDRLTGCSLERMRLVIAEIAGFHATWWNHPEAPEVSGKYTPQAVLGWQAWFAHEANRLDEIPEIPCEPALVQTIKDLSLQLADTMQHQRTSPCTLIHHDYHLGNVIFIETQAATKVMVIDWQDLSVGRGPTDVALMLGSSMTIEDRRSHEQALVKLYYDTLCAHGVTGYSFDRCWDDYRLGMFETLWRTVILLGRQMLQGAAYAEHRDVFGPRIYAAVVDLDAREALSRLEM